MLTKMHKLLLLRTLTDIDPVEQTDLKGQNPGTKPPTVIRILLTMHRRKQGSRGRLCSISALECLQTSIYVYIYIYVVQLSCIQW